MVIMFLLGHKLRICTSTKFQKLHFLLNYGKSHIPFTVSLTRNTRTVQKDLSANDIIILGYVTIGIGLGIRDVYVKLVQFSSIA